MTAWITIAALTCAMPTRLVVGFDGPDLRQRDARPRTRAVVQDLGGVLVRRLSFALVIDVDVDDVDRALSTARSMPGVRWAERDVLIPIQLRKTPDDPLYPAQWHLHPNDEAVANTDIEVESAWDITTGLLAGGGSVRVAVLDDGFDLDHPDLVDRFADVGLDVSSQEHLVDNDPSWESEYIQDYHGTQTAGVIAATGFNSACVVGVCPDCTLLPVRLIGGGGPADLYTEGSTAAAAIDWAIDNGADVINNSWGPEDRNRFDPTSTSELWPMPQVLQDAMRRAATVGRGGLGTVITWAAGNGAELTTYDRFASDPRAIAVGSIAANGRLAPYSDYGPTVAIVAPSSGARDQPKIVTTDIAGVFGATDRDDSDRFGGTSASAAMVAGVAALVLAAYPQLTAAQVQEALLLSAFPIDPARGDYDASGRSILYGHGRVDAHGALLHAALYDDECTMALDVCDNGRDDDCDDAVDDPETCDNPCIPTRAGREECNGIDDNCDGQIDELFVCETTDRPLCAPCTQASECATTLVCHGQEEFSGTWCLPSCDTPDDCPYGFDRCEANACLLTVTPDVQDCMDILRCHLPERCDGIDNDCNGTIDDIDPSGLEAQAVMQSCGTLGVCASAEAACVGSRWECAYPSSWQASETLCDGLDNDCNGKTDDLEACENHPSRESGGCDGCSFASPHRTMHGVAALLLTAFWWLRSARSCRKATMTKTSTRQ